MANMTGRSTRFILIASSDSQDLYYTAMLLQRFEYNIYTAKTAEEALEMAAIAVPALILTDLHLQGTSGLEFIVKTKKKSTLAGVPIIAMISNTLQDKERQLLEAASVQWVQKPVQAEELYRMVQSSMETTPRKSIRIPARLPVSINNLAMDFNAGEYVSILSEQGAFVRTLNPQNPKSHLSIKLTINERAVYVDCSVLYSYSFGGGSSKEPGMGLEFRRISSQDQEYIRQYIRAEITRGIKPI